MKKSLKIVILFVSLSIIFLIGCGKDGDDGKAFIAIDWVSVPDRYWDNNPGIPNTIFKGHYYESEKGSYSFDYNAWDGSFYAGIYTITIEEGKSGDLISDGKDGDDNYFKLWLYSFGPSIYIENLLEDEEFRVIKSGYYEIDQTHELTKKEIQDEQILNSFDSEVIVVEKRQGRYKLKIEFQHISE